MTTRKTMIAGTLVSAISFNPHSHLHGFVEAADCSPPGYFPELKMNYKNRTVLLIAAFLILPITIPAPLEAATLKITPKMNARIKAIMGHSIGRTARYRKSGGSTIWVLNRIGKVKPITAKFTVSGGRISSARILAYRESHGHEVKRASFLGRLRSSCNAPNISGATLSVNSMRRMCRLAKYLHSQVH